MSPEAAAPALAIARIDALLRCPAEAEARAARASDIARGLAWEHVRPGYPAAPGLAGAEAAACSR